MRHFKIANPGAENMVDLLGITAERLDQIEGIATEIVKLAPLKNSAEIMKEIDSKVDSPEEFLAVFLIVNTYLIIGVQEVKSKPKNTNSL